MHKHVKNMAWAAAIAVGTAGVASAAPISIMIGDNDGYGAGIADNGNTSGFAVANTDNRSAAEAAATNGAQLTDVYSAIFPAFGPNPGDTGSFIFDFVGVLTSAIVTIDMADFQASVFGEILADFNGVAVSMFFDDGFENSVVRSFALNAAQLAAANADGFVSLNFDRNGSGDFIAFDYLQLDGDLAPIPVPAAGLLLLGGLGSLAAMRRRKSKKS